jgi:hypothetical protein
MRLFQPGRYRTSVADDYLWFILARSFRLAHVWFAPLTVVNKIQIACCRFTDGQVQTVNRTQCQFCYRNPSAVEDSDDFLTLPNLDEPNILHSLR